jgi:hypothetical protein
MASLKHLFRTALDGLRRRIAAKPAKRGSDVGPAPCALLPALAEPARPAAPEATVVLGEREFECLVTTRTPDKIVAICRPVGTLGAVRGIDAPSAIFSLHRGTGAWVPKDVRAIGVARHERQPCRMALLDCAHDVLGLTLQQPWYISPGDALGWAAWCNHRQNDARPVLVARAQAA